MPLLCLFRTSHREISEAAATQGTVTFAAIAQNPEQYVETFMQIAAKVLRDEDIECDADDEEEDQEQAIIERLRESAEMFLSHIKGGKMRVYRAMEVGGGWDPTEDGLGIYWTVRKSVAAYGEFSGVLLEGIIDVVDINLWETLAMQLTGLAEDEVRLWPTATVSLRRISLKGKPIMRPLWNQTYPADIG